MKAACLYVSYQAMEFRDSDVRFTLVKYGISDYETPHYRMSQHKASRDNPFRTRLQLKPVASIRLAYLSIARDFELVLKRMFVRRLQQFVPGTIKLALAPGRKPSGEWLMCEAEPVHALSVFGSMAQGELADVAEGTSLPKYSGFAESFAPISETFLKNSLAYQMRATPPETR